MANFSKDYSDFVDWTYNVAGIDPADFSSNAAYLNHLKKNYAPANKSDWSQSSLDFLQEQRSDLYNQIRGLQTKIKVRSKTPLTPKQIKSLAVKQTRQPVSRYDKMDSLYRRLLHRKDRTFTKGEQKGIQSIRNKRISNTKLNKPERRIFQRTVFLRAAELRTLVNSETKQLFTQKDSLTRAYKELGSTSVK